MKPTPRQVFDNWMKLCDHYDKMGRTILKLASHPDALKDGQFEETAKALHAYATLSQRLRESKPKIMDIVRHDWGMYQKVERRLFP